MNFPKRHWLDTKAFPAPISRSRVLSVLYWAAIITGLFLLKTNISFYGVVPNFTVLIPFYAGLKKSPEKGLLTGMGIGLVEDSLTHSILGPNILSKGMVGLLSPLMSGRFFIWTPLFGIAALFGMTFLDGLVSYGARGIFLSPPVEFGEAVTNIFFQSLINAPIGFFIRPQDE